MEPQAFAGLSLQQNPTAAAATASTKKPLDSSQNSAAEPESQANVETEQTYGTSSAASAGRTGDSSDAEPEARHKIKAETIEESLAELRTVSQQDVSSQPPAPAAAAPLGTTAAANHAADAEKKNLPDNSDAVYEVSSLSATSNEDVSHSMSSKKSRRRWKSLQHESVSPAKILRAQRAEAPQFSTTSVATVGNLAAEPDKGTVDGLEKTPTAAAKPEESAASAQRQISMAALLEEAPCLVQLSAEIQLVAWLGHNSLLEDLVPSDVLAVLHAETKYCLKHSCSEGGWFNVICAWLKDKHVIDWWTEVAPEPAAEPDTIANALFYIFRDLATYKHRELGRVLRGGRGTGYVNFFLSLGLMVLQHGEGDMSKAACINEKVYFWTQDRF